MAKNVVFRLKKESELVLKDGKFIENDSEIWLTVTTKNQTSYLQMLGNNLDEIKLDDILKLINPRSVYCLINRELDEYEIKNVEDLLKLSKSYFLNVGEDIIEISKMTDEEIREHINDFKVELEKAVLKYGEDNVDIVYNESSDSYSVMYHSGHDSFGCSEEYSAKYITDLIIKEMVDKFDCGYCD